MRSGKIVFLFVFMISISASNCREVYIPPSIKNNENILVVDGIIVAGNDSTVITLSRTRPLTDSTSSLKELNAQVSVVGLSGTEFPLTDEGNGRYGIDQLLLDNTQTYQLKIVTSDGNEFRSALSQVLISPPMDSVYWIQDSVGVHIYVDTHDPANITHYYQWMSVETYEYHSEYNSFLLYIDPNNIVPRSLSNQIFRCYATQNSSSIEVANTSRLSSDIVSRFEVTTVPAGSIKISAVYSTLVKQYALSEDAFNFWQNLKKNTEQLGSLFDLQPFTELGNIRCTNHPELKCIGFTSITSQQEQRIFISKNQVFSWDYHPYYGLCNIDTVLTENISKYFQPPGGPYGSSVIGTVDIPFLNPSPYLVSTVLCVDCSYHGGTTIKPPFWP